MTEMVFRTYSFWCAVFGGVAGMISGLLVLLFFKICEAKAQREVQEDENCLVKHGSIAKSFQHESPLKLPEEHDERFLQNVSTVFFYIFVLLNFSGGQEYTLGSRVLCCGPSNLEQTTRFYSIREKIFISLKVC